MTDGFWHTFTCPHCQRKHVAWVERDPLPFSDNARRVLAFAPEVWKRGTPCGERTLSKKTNLSRRAVRKALRELEPLGYVAAMPHPNGGTQYVGVLTMIRTVEHKLAA